MTLVADHFVKGAYRAVSVLFTRATRAPRSGMRGARRCAATSSSTWDAPSTGS